MLCSEELILEWLNKDLNFTPSIKNISKEFQNCYNFAEILFKVKEINEKQFQEFIKDSKDKNLIRKNFLLIKKYFHEKFNLELRNEEFDEIYNKNISKAVVILYKLKNSIRLKKIKFFDIKTSLYPHSKNEINEKVKKIIDYEYFNDIFNKDLLYDIIPKEETKFDFTSNLKTVTFSEPKIYQSTLSGIINNKENKKITEFSEYENLSTKLSNIIPTKNSGYLSREISKDSFNKLPIIYSNKSQGKYNNNLTTRNKWKNNLLLTDVTSNKQKFGDGTSNIARENKFRIAKLTEHLFKLGVSDLQFNFKHTLPEFNPDTTHELDKVRIELRKKMTTLNEEKKQKSYKKNTIKILSDVPEIDFRSSENNNTRTKKNITLAPLQKRIKYCKEWHTYINQRKLEKKIKYFASKIKNSNKKEEIKENIFNEEYYLSSLNIDDIEKINDSIKTKKEKNKKNYPLIKKISLSIIDMTMEVFFYQEGKKTDIIDIENYTKFLELFIDNKNLGERVDYEARLIKEKNKDEIEINVDRLNLTSEEQDLKEDYKNFVGFFNSNIIMDKKFKGMKIDIKTLRNYLAPDYEPTEMEIEDLTLPLNKEDNYPYGDLILELLDNKFKEKNVVKEKGKWDYIKYKIALIGLPFCGKNFIGEEIRKKYPNIKTYSINNILRSYYNEYKTITEPIENNPKFKSMKPNQIEQLKQEKENMLKEFEPKLNLIQPYIDLINNSNINNNNNTSNSKDEEKDKHNNIIIPSDELLLNILIYNIEKDFPKISEEEQKNEITNLQNNISNLLKQKANLEKQIQESKKPNPKDEQNLLNIDKEIEKEKNNSVKGFILIDFPSNINQCNLLEYYLNGYVDVTKKPKSEKNQNIEKINNLIDFNFLPIEGNKAKRAGIDFIINIITTEELVNNRFNKKKYDPLNDKIYSEYELSQEIITKDKKLMERLEDNIPYYTNEHFNYYKSQYNENISKICTFYSQFCNQKNINLLEPNSLNIENNEKESNKTYQEVLIEEEKVMDEVDEEKAHEEKIEEKGKKNPVINKEQLLMINKENEIKEKIYNFVNRSIQFLYEEKEDQDKKIFFAEHPDLNQEEQDEEKDKIQFDPEFKINEIREGNIPKKAKKESITNLKNFHFLNDNFDIVLSDLKKFNNKYEKHIGKFIYLIKKQQNDIYSRLILIQKKYRDFLNQRSDKKKVINLYCQKYNSFFTEFPTAFNSVTAINDFSEDIDKLNSALWSFINLKETVSIKELQEIKNSNFIEHELKKFYKYMKEVFLIETEKFLNVINSIFDLYHNKKNEESTKDNLIKVNNNTMNKNNNNNNKKEQKKNKIVNYRLINSKELIFTDEIEISDDYVDNNDNEDITNINYQNKRILYKNPEQQSNLDYLINHNIEIIFNNCLDLILCQQQKIDTLLKSIKDLTNPSLKKNPKLKKKMIDSFSSSVMSTFIQTKEGGMNVEDNVKKIFDREKDKYKYRICFLRSFVTRYIIIIDQTSKKVFRNIDDWIISSVALQSEARSLVIQKLKNILKEKRLINEEKDINNIELDAFEESEKEKSNESKIYQKLNVDYLINDDFVNIGIKEEIEHELKKKKKLNDKIIRKNYKIIVPNRNNCSEGYTKINKLSDKFNINDFAYNIWKLYEIYNKIKLFEIKKNVISQNMFYENFVKKYLFNKSGHIKDDSFYDDININYNNLINMNYFQTNKNVIQSFKDKDKINDNKLPGICKALTTLTSKNIKKLFSLFQLNIEYPNDDEIKKEAKENIEYDKYLDTIKLFTILSLIGSEVLTEKMEKDLMNNLKLKLIKDKYLSKMEFLRYNFWFESNFKFNDNPLPNKKTSIVMSKSPRKIFRQKTKNFTNLPAFKMDKMGKSEERNNFFIKNLLYILWKDEKENMINIKEFLDVLKVENYCKKIDPNRNEIYFDVIFGDEK